MPLQDTQHESDNAGADREGNVDEVRTAQSNLSLHLRTDRPWSHPDWAWLRITDLEPGGRGALVYWRVEGHYRQAPAAVALAGAVIG